MNHTASEPSKLNKGPRDGLGRASHALAIALAGLFTLSGGAAADPIIKCVQRELKESGFNPRGVDGQLGPNTVAAAARWARRSTVELPDLSADTSPRWCATLLTRNDKLPDPAPGTERFCVWFGDVLNGVWLDPEGLPKLRFRYASGADGAGCYGWLNTALRPETRF